MLWHERWMAGFARRKSEAASSRVEMAAVVVGRG